MNVQLDAEHKDAEQKARRFWVSLVVGLLGMQVVIGAVALKLATGDSSAAVIPNYHVSALNWDATHQKRTALQRFGWSLVIEPSDVADGAGNRAIRVRIEDSDGQGVESLELTAQTYHHARGSDVRSLEFTALSGGDYQSIVPLKQIGLWEMELLFEANGESLSVMRTIDVK